MLQHLLMVMQKIFYSVFWCIFKEPAHIFVMVTQNWSLFLGFETQTNHVLSHLTGRTLQDDVIAKFKFQRPGSY